jgi:hypothetical protein
VRRLPKPTVSAHSSFTTCSSTASPDELKQRLLKVTPTIVASAEQYEVLANLRCLHLAGRRDSIDGLVSLTEMKDLYKRSMSSRTGIARDIYDELVSSVPYRICPLCGVGVVSTLDHHLPQSQFADFIVTPINLIPACADCNKAKLAQYPKLAQEQTIHPYFETFTDETWLFAEVLHSSPPAIRFYVSPPPHWNEVDRTIVNRHFSVFKLAPLFTANAANELSSLRHQLVARLKGDALAIKKFLEEQAESCRDAHRNSWRTAAYTALSKDDWFLSSGFLQIPKT